MPKKKLVPNQPGWFGIYFLASLKVVLAVLEGLLPEVTVTLTLHNTPAGRLVMLAFTGVVLLPRAAAGVAPVSGSLKRL
jgi:hypothetical protein